MAAAVLLLTLGLASIVTGTRLWRSAAPDVGTVPPVTAARPAPAGPAAAAPAPSPTAVPFAPARVRVPRLGLDAPVVPVTEQPDGLLAVPADVHTIGWWSAGAAAASPSGTVVLVGHVDSARQGPGAFFALRTLQPGDQVVLSGGGGRTVAYTVAARRQYPKTALPAGAMFGQDTTQRLVLVTCGGTFNWDTHHYSDNVVVYAMPATA
ncbi:MAG: class F sortase [Actinobacteria bacterium]|nr:class F sortase [Actinomycetota bacterium]